MNFLVLCLSDGYGGLELYALREITLLQKKGHNCVPVVARGSMLDKQLGEAGIAREYLNIWNRRLPVFAARQLARLIEQYNVDVVHMHWNKDLNLAVLAKAFSSRKVLLVYTRHMEITRSKKDFLHKWFYKNVDLMLVTTKILLEQAVNYLPLDQAKIKLLYLGVRAPQQSSPNCDEFFHDERFPKRSLNIALFGRIEPYKGQHVLVGAVARLVKQGLDISVTIVGHVMDKPYYQGLKQEISGHDVEKNFNFKGFVKNPVEFMRCFDVVVLTTYCETFGLVLVEAMRAGVAVIGTNAGGVPEIIDNNVSGMLVEPANIASLAEVIEKLYNDRILLDAIAQQGKQKADNLFSENKHFSTLNTLLSTATK